MHKRKEIRHEVHNNRYEVIEKIILNGLDKKLKNHQIY